MQQLSVDNQIIRKLKPVWIITNLSLRTEWRRRGSYSVLSRINITTKPRVFQYQIFVVDHKLSEKSPRRTCFRLNRDNPNMSYILIHIAYIWRHAFFSIFLNFIWNEIVGSFLNAIHVCIKVFFYVKAITY